MPETVEMDVRYSVSPDAVESKLGDETVILHLGSGIYFGADHVGTIVWERLKLGETPAAICAHVRAAFEDVPASVERDVQDFLRQLAENDLIRPA